MPLEVGAKAPDFELYDTEKKKVTLKEILGEKTVLAFFPGAFTSVCTTEMCGLRDHLADFNELGGRVYGISVDGPAANRAFAELNRLGYPVLSDFTRETSKKYCGLHEDFWGISGYSVAKRSIFVLDKSGTVIYRWISDNPGELPNYDDINDALHRSNS
jgi:glutaredoxin-dependent peroxiredoxin